MSSRSSGRRKRWLLLLAAVAVVSLQIVFWGRPVEPRFRIVGRPALGAPGPHEWVYEPRPAPAEFWHARDTKGDGVIDSFDTPAGSFAHPGSESPPQRWLVICLDGVPLNVLQRLWDQGHFREFFRPTPVISIFPSYSEVALTAALHAGPLPGYEDRYFDRERNRIRGGAWVTLTGAGIPFLYRLDYDPPGWAKILPYILPRKTYRADLGRLRKQFLGSRAHIFIAHITASDPLMHLMPAKEAEPLVLEFEGLVRELYLGGRGKLGVLVFSDHGNSETPSRGVHLEPFLAQHGWRLRSSVVGPRHVVVPAYGLIGFIAVYCQPAAAPELAQQLAGLEGIDVVVYRNADGGVTILRAGEQAELRWRPDGRAYQYRPARGDPLGLLPVFENLRVLHRLDEGGWASDADLFAATAAAWYPDAAARLRDWATNHVRNPAPVMASLQPGYYHGAGIFQSIVSFHGTHGALEASSSVGFAMATRPLPPVVRLGDLLEKGWLAGRSGGED